MSNFEVCKRELRDDIYAGVPLVTIQSAERPRIERMLRQLAGECGISIFYYTEARQVQSLGGAAAPKDVESDPLTFATDLFLKTKHTVFVLGDTRKLDQDSLYTREMLSAVLLAKETGNTLVTVGVEVVWPRLARFGMQIKLDFPDFDERRTMVALFAKDFAEKVNWSDRDEQQLATLTRGLSEMQIHNLLRSALVRQGSLDSKDFYDIAARKELLFAHVSNVIPVTNRQNLEVAGLERLKEWLDRKREVFFAPEELLSRYALTAPKGILLTGVPGCGKSFSARMIASRWELPLLRFDLGSVYNKYVGETERRMQEALDYIDNVAPCVLWIDEIEKALSTTTGESDVAQRVLGQFLFWLQESQARVFLVATANDVTNLPPELFRKGRFSETFFVDLPNLHERMEAIRLYAKQSLRVSYPDETVRELALQTKGFSYSDIEQSIKDIAEDVMFGRIAAADYETLSAHFAETIPISETNDAVSAIRQWGVGHAQRASLEVEDEQ